MTYLSQERHDQLKDELKSLKNEGRREVAENLRQAKELGDLSENIAYEEAREEQSRLEGKIAQLDQLLANSSIIQKSAGGAVSVGSEVEVEKDGENLTYFIVGSNEADPAKGMISNESPIGQQLLGKKEGDTISVTTPKGASEFKILSIK